MFLNTYVPNGYYTTSTLQTSVANAEILELDVNQTRQYRNVSFYNKDALTLIFVDAKGVEHELYLESAIGFSIDPNYLPITSLKVKENSKQFTLMAAY